MGLATKLNVARGALTKTHRAPGGNAALLLLSLFLDRPIRSAIVAAARAGEGPLMAG